MVSIALTGGFVLGITQYAVKSRGPGANAIEVYLGLFSIRVYFDSLEK